MSELTKQELYESVKTLVEMEQHKHLHLTQHKLFTLFSIAFQYLLYSSTKNPGQYIIRAEDGQLADKLAKKAKDPATRKFMQALLLPRKLTYGKSTFFLDFFPVATWNMTKDLPRDKVRGALVVKNTSVRPMNDVMMEENPEEIDPLTAHLPKDYYLSSLQEFVPKTLTIAFEEQFNNVHEVVFPFIKKDVPRSISGVTLGKNIDWENID